MKKILLAMSIVGFIIAIIMSWFCSVSMGIVTAIILGVLIGVNVYLIKNNPRLWISITMFILSLLLLFLIGSGIGCRIAKNSTSNIEVSDVYNEEESEVVIEEDELEEIEDEDVYVVEEDIEEDNVVVKEVVKEVPVEVEKVVVKEIVKEVPVEKEVIKEVPKIEYVEVEKKPETNTQAHTPTPNPTPSTTPIPNNNINYGGPTTVYGYGYNGYGYQNGYGTNYNSTSIKIKGATEVVAGDSETYTISGVNSISESKLDVSENVSYRIHSGNKITLYFDEDFTGGYCMIKYGSAKLKVDIIPCD